MGEDDVDMDELREKTTVGNRVEEDSKAGNLDEFRDSLRGHLEEIENGDRQKTVSVWDGDVNALLSALEDHPEVMERAGQNLREELDREGDGEVDRAEIVRLALRAGLQQADEDLVEALLDTKADLVRKL